MEDRSELTRVVQPRIELVLGDAVDVYARPDGTRYVHRTDVPSVGGGGRFVGRGLVVGLDGEWAIVRYVSLNSPGV